jgi:hypothetical protein
VSEFEARPVPGTESALQPAFSPNGESLAFWADGGVKRVSLSGGAPVRLYDVSPAPFGISWSPRGEAVTFVEPFPPTGTKYQVARGGRPLWTPSGTQLYFIPGPGRLAVTRVTTARDGFTFTAPQDVRRRFGLAPPGSPRTFDFLPDGRLVGINTPAEDGAASATAVHVVQNWFEELKAKSIPRR